MTLCDRARGIDLDYLNGYLVYYTSMSDNGDRPFNAYYKQCNRQGTITLFSQVSVVQSAQNFIEITIALAVGVSKSRD